MRKEIKDFKFIIGGILVALMLLTGGYPLSLWGSPYTLGPAIMFTLIFFIVLIIGLKLISDALIKKS